MPLPEGWRAMFVYRGDDGEVVLHSSPLKFWTLVEGSKSRCFADGVTERRVCSGNQQSPLLRLLARRGAYRGVQEGCRSPFKEARGSRSAPVAYQGLRIGASGAFGVPVLCFAD
jgi:hypothetical protein